MAFSEEHDEIESDQYGRYRTTIKDEDSSNLVGKRVPVDIEIESDADRERNEFTAIFGYPVMNLDTSFIADVSDITNIDVVDVVSSRNAAIKQPLIGKKVLGAKVSVRGWIFPDSAIIYVWNRQVA